MIIEVFGGPRSPIRLFREQRLTSEMRDLAAIDALAQACRTGPAGARVEDVERAPSDDDGSTDFQERPTAKA